MSHCKTLTGRPETEHKAMKGLETKTFKLSIVIIKSVAEEWPARDGT